MNNIIKVTDEEHRKFLKEIGFEDPDNLPTREFTEEEKEGTMFIFMSRIAERMIWPDDLTKEKWDKLIKYGMVYSKDTEDGIEYYMTEKALDWIESIKDPNFDFKDSVSHYREGESLWLVHNEHFWDKLKKKRLEELSKKTKGDVDTIL